MDKPARPSPVIALLVAGALFMEQLDGTVIATALPQMAPILRRCSGRPQHRHVGLSAHRRGVHSGQRLGRRSVRRPHGLRARDRGVHPVLGAVRRERLAHGFTVARIAQGVGGAMMVPVGRLIVLRTTEKQYLIRAIAF